MVDRPSSPADVRDPTVVRALGALLIAATAYVALRRQFTGDFQYVVWSDRELARSHVPFFDLPTAGAELSYGVGAGTPGGAIHLLLWLVSWVSDSPRAAWLTQVGFDTLAAAVIGWTVGRGRGLFAGAVAAAVFLSAAPNVTNQSQLWNPAFMSLFLAVGTACWVRALVDEDERALVGWGAALALAAQMHITAGVLALVMLPGLLLARTPRLGRGLFGALLGALAMYTPYMIHELRHGFTNVTQLLNPAQIEDLTHPVLASARPWDNMVGAVLTLASHTTVLAMSSMVDVRMLVPVEAIGPLLVAIGLGLALRRGEPKSARALAAATAIALVGGVIALARSRSYNFVSGNVSRYLIFLVPVTAVAAGLGVDALIKATRARSQAVASLLAVLLTASLGLRLVAADAQTTAAGGHTLAWERLSRWLDAAQVDTGMSLPELVRHTTAVSWKYGNGWRREEAVPVDALLQAQGARFDGPASAPCFAVFVIDHQDPTLVGGLTQADLTQALGPGAEPAMLLSTATLGPDTAIVRFQPATGLCPTNMVQRYLLTPEEQITFDDGPDVPANTAVRLEDVRGARRWLVSLDTGPTVASPTNTIYAVITLRDTRDRQELALHSNQLRGYAWNGGFFLNVIVRAPRLMVRDDTGAVVAQAPFAPGLVGREGLVTPLRVSADLPAGKLVFAVDVPPFDPATIAVIPGVDRTVEVTLP